MTDREAFEHALSIVGYYDATWVGDLGDLEKLVQAATAAALERAAAVRTKLPPAKYGENASAPQQIYQDAFDRGWQAGISAMRGAIRALKEQQ